MLRLQKGVDKVNIARGAMLLSGFFIRLWQLWKRRTAVTWSRKFIWKALWHSVVLDSSFQDGASGKLPSAEYLDTKDFK